MDKADFKQHKSIRLERLERFLRWLRSYEPDITAKKNQQEQWFIPYNGYPNPAIGQAAKAFWLGLTESAVNAALAEFKRFDLIGKVLAREPSDYRCAVDLFGVEREFTIGSVHHLLKADWALCLPPSDSPQAFTENVRLSVQALVRERLHILAHPFAQMSSEERQQVVCSLRPELARLDDFLDQAIDILNNVKHDLRYVIELRHNGLALDLQRRIPVGQSHVLSEEEVLAWKAQDQQELHERLAELVDAAGDFDLQLISQKQLTDLLQQRPQRLRKAIRAMRTEYAEKMAFAKLLENDPRFVHYHRLYPARQLTRRWVAWLGPTNSGKTHRAIEAMAAVTHAIYLSPLRLMALENQERIESMGIPCTLITGEEEIIREGATHFCCTVEEFARFRQQAWQVVVVDEVQMLADPQRGWAWVDALVSAYTPELIMTGPALIEPSLQTLCKLCEDHLQIKHTKRLSPVSVARHATTLAHLEPGSMLVAFSRRTVLELKGLL